MFNGLFFNKLLAEPDEPPLRWSSLGVQKNRHTKIPQQEHGLNVFANLPGITKTQDGIKQARTVQP